MRHRRAAEPTTVLGAAIRSRRTTQASLAEQVGVPQTTLSRIERGTHAPSVATALALAKWLGWSVEQVIEAAATPARSES